MDRPQLVLSIYNGQLDFGFLQLVTISALVMSQSELCQQANYIVDVAAYGRQADLDLWVQQLVMASQQHDQWQQQQAQEVQRQVQQQQQQQQRQQQERQQAAAEGRPTPAPSSVWQELYKQRQLPQRVYEPIGERDSPWHAQASHMLTCLTLRTLLLTQ